MREPNWSSPENGIINQQQPLRQLTETALRSKFVVGFSWKNTCRSPCTLIYLCGNCSEGFGLQLVFDSLLLVYTHISCALVFSSRTLPNIVYAYLLKYWLVCYDVWCVENKQYQAFMRAVSWIAVLPKKMTSTEVTSSIQWTTTLTMTQPSSTILVAVTKQASTQPLYTVSTTPPSSPGEHLHTSMKHVYIGFLRSTMTFRLINLHKLTYYIAYMCTYII